MTDARSATFLAAFAAWWLTASPLLAQDSPPPTIKAGVPSDAHVIDGHLDEPAVDLVVAMQVRGGEDPHEFRLW